ncbi:MAG: TonB-dependent receptor [Proteobacteria bacterium]|nr:TonB-dependent receptor [Pseudomonadota bacterium]
MLQRAYSALSLVLAGLLLAPLAVAQTVTGEVTDANNRVVFAGARVSIEGHHGSAVTDDRGKFRISGVPAGEYTLVVSYVGAADTRVPITVTADGLALGSVAIGGGDGSVEEVIVYGQAAALAGAINQERTAQNLISVLDTDAMGQFPDQNVAESLRRLSGVTVENDQGEGRYVVIRGMDPDLNATSINGVRASAAEPRRAMQLDVIPSDVLDGIEIYKTLSADMDADAIGGSINVKTLSAFSRKGTYIKARAESSYNELREEWSPKLSIAGSNNFVLNSGRRLGVAAAISWHDRDLLANNNESDDWEVADNGSDYPEEFQPRLYTIGRERIGGVLNFDLDVSDSTRLYAYTLYSKFTDTEIRNRVTFDLSEDDVLDQATVTDTNADFSFVEIERDTKGRAIRGQIAETLSIALGSETQLDTWLVETQFGYSYGRERTPDQVDGTWVAEFETGVGPITAGSPVLTLDRTNQQIPVITSDFWTALADESLYELDEIENSHEKNEDTQTSVALDFGRETGFGSMKFGVKMRWREKKTNEDVEIYSGDGTWFLDDALLPNGGAAYGFPTPVDPVPDNSIERDILAGGIGIDFEDLDSEIDSNVADFVYDEDVLAAYAMATWDMDRASFTVGLRVERTETDNRGNLVEFIEEDLNGPGIPPEDIVIVTPISATNSYTDVLPSANLRFEFSDRLVGRASFFRSVVRPRIEEVAFRVELEDGEAELGNPDLDPFRAWNVDASLAFYPTELSVLSIGVFYKKIEDFIFVQVIDDFEFLGITLDEAVIALNGEDATVFGIEFNYQQHLGFLSPPFDGLLVGLNYTYVDAEADTGDRKVAMPKQSANIANVMLGYEKGGFDFRVAMKYRDRYIDELVDPDYDRYTSEHTQWDVTARYRFSDNWLVYAEVTNLGDEPEHYYAGKRSRLYQYDEYGTISAIGIQYNFQD